MSKFYSSIVDYYEKIFEVNSQQIDFLLENNPKTALDIACATGSTMELLRKGGVEVTGIDLDPMFVGRAKEKGLDVKVLNMLDLEEEERTFDLVYCIGNSIAHLEGHNQLEIFLRKAYNKVKEGGELVISFINFEPFLKGKPDEQGLLGNLPTIEKEGLSFVREYYKEEDHIRFHTILKTNDREIENNERLFPFSKEEVLKQFEEKGFNKIEVYGSFNKDDFDIEKSMSIIIRGIK